MKKKEWGEKEETVVEKEMAQRKEEEERWRC